MGSMSDGGGRQMVKVMQSSGAGSPYRHPKHTHKAFLSLNAMRQERVLCDVTLIVEGEELPAHRAVLAACSPYFHAMFHADLSEAHMDAVQIQGVEPVALAALLDFVYTSEISVCEDSVQSLLAAATMLQLAEVREACCDFLQGQLHPSNSLGIRAFADLHSCQDLLRQANTFTEQHFSEVVQHEEFMNLKHDQVEELISSDRLTVASEEQVFEAVVAWVKHHEQSRRQYIASLFKYVRLPLMSRDYLLRKVSDEPLLEETPCKDYVIEALKYHLLQGDAKASYKTPRTLPRTPVGVPKLLLVLGGQAPKAIRSVETFDFQDGKWLTCKADMPSRRCRCGVATLNGLVYAIGGFNGSLRVRSVDVYDPQSGSWGSVASMEARRSTLGAAVLKDLLYAVGGFDGSTGLATAEVYNPRVNEWRSIASMCTRRSSVGVAGLDGLLYAVGGYDGLSRQCLSSVECYDPDQDAWEPVPDMSCRRSGAGVSVVDGALYAVGGHDGPLVRKSVEMYDPAARQWSMVADMTTCRRNAGVAANDGILYVVGGDDGTANLSSVELYNPKLDQWSFLLSEIDTGRSYAGCAVVDRPSRTATSAADASTEDERVLVTLDQVLDAPGHEPQGRPRQGHEAQGQG